MIRPELKSALWRWREVIAALGLAALGLWWGFASFGVLKWLGWALAGFGALVAFSAAQKVRFKAEGDGPGVVTIDERRVTYLGPLDGGIADLDLMVRLDLTPAPNATWRLINLEGNALSIPVNASGAEELFDLFNTLPGIRKHLLAGLPGVKRDGTVTIWRSGKEPSFHRLPPTVH